MFETIVVPLDGSELSARALHPASAIAVRTGADLRVVSAVSHDRDVATRTRELETQIQQTGILAISVDVSVGNPADLISTEAGHLDQLVCMASHSRGRIGEALFGSVAEVVVRHARRPILLVGPHYEPPKPIPLDRMLVALDGSRPSREVMPFVAEWAEHMGLKVSLALVVTPSAIEQAMRQSVPGESVVESAPLERVAAALIDQGLTVDWDVLHGPDPATSIVQAATEGTASIIAMTTHGRTGLARIVAGSVAMAVVHHSPCPVLLLRPPSSSSS